MRYLKNNGKPSKLTINEQAKCGYINKKGEKKEVHVVMWRDPNASAVQNKEAMSLGISQDRKAIIRYMVRPDGRLVEETDERKELGYSQVVANFPHIINFPVGTSHKDERLYNIMVGEIAEVENDDDADQILKTFHFIDEVDQKGIEVETTHYMTGNPVKGNPYRPEPSSRPDRRLAPTRFDEVPTEMAPRANPIEKRVTEIVKAGEEIESL